MEDLNLEPDTLRMLDEIRNPDPAMPDQWLRHVAQGRSCVDIARDFLSALGLPMVPFRCQMQYARSLSPLFRKHAGQTLVHELNYLFIRWRGLGLDSHVMQALTCHCYETLKRDALEHHAAPA